MRGAFKMSSDIIANTIAASIKEEVFLCVSLLVFVTLFYHY